MSPGYLPNDEQAKPDTALCQVAAVPTDHGFEQVIEVFLDNGRALVVHDDTGPVDTDLRSDCHRCLRVAISKGIGNQIADQLTEPIRIECHLPLAQAQVQQIGVGIRQPQFIHTVRHSQLQVRYYGLDHNASANSNLPLIQQIGHKPLGALGRVSDVLE